MRSMSIPALSILTAFAVGSAVSGCSSTAARLSRELRREKAAKKELERRIRDLKERHWQTSWAFDAAEAEQRRKVAAEKLGLPVEKAPDLGKGVRLALVLIPPGTFAMGRLSLLETSQTAENRAHRVRITSPFYMGKYEVTQAIWKHVMGENPAHFKGSAHPVEKVSWDDCQEFLERLNAAVREPLTFRLPTEAEWEWACRAGTVTPFYLGDDITPADAHYDAKYNYTGGGKADGRTFGTVPAGKFKPNAWGLYDMMGNVYEWCSDWYGEHYYQTGPVDDPQGPEEGNTRVMRGGAWNYYPNESCGSSFRAARRPEAVRYSVGLRVVGEIRL